MKEKGRWGGWGGVNRIKGQGVVLEASEREKRRERGIEEG